MQYTKCSKKLPGQLSPDRRNEIDPNIDSIHVPCRDDLVAHIQLTKAHGSTLTPRFMQGGGDKKVTCANWKTQTKEDFVPREGAEFVSKKLQQERCNQMRESAYLPLQERNMIPFSRRSEDVHSVRSFQAYGTDAYHVERKDRVAAHPSRSNVVLDAACEDRKHDVELRSRSTMHLTFQKPDVAAVGKLKSKDARAENQQELMRSNWSYGEPDHLEGGSKNSARSLAHCVSVAKQPLTREAAVTATAGAVSSTSSSGASLPSVKQQQQLHTLSSSSRPDDAKLSESRFLEGQSGASAKYFSRVPYQSGCNLASSTANPALLTLPGSGTTMKSSFPSYGADAAKTLANARAGAENMGHTEVLSNGKKVYVPSSVQVGNAAQPTCYVTSQKSQYRGVWFDGKK